MKKTFYSYVACGVNTRKAFAAKNGIIGKTCFPTVFKSKCTGFIELTIQQLSSTDLEVLRKEVHKEVDKRFNNYIV